MTRLKRNHPFAIRARQAELLEQQAGKVTPTVLAIRKELQVRYPDIFKVYIAAKKSRQEKRLWHQETESERGKTEAKYRNVKILSMRKYGKHVGDDQRHG